jgi:hypothetical protein
MWLRIAARGRRQENSRTHFPGAILGTANS